MGKFSILFKEIYRLDMQQLSRLRRYGVTLLRFVMELGQQFAKDTVIVRASGMAYTTLLAIVPLVAVFFSIFSAFEAFALFKETAETWILKQVIPARTDELLNYLNQFTANTKALGVVSSIALVITSILLFDNIEKNFNAIWKVLHKRSLLRRFMTFTNVLIWGPVLIALSFYATGKIRALFPEALVHLGFLQRFLLSIFPWLLSVGAFCLMNVVIPATKVRIKSAILGGVVGGTIWEFAKLGFSNYVARSITYNAIYGSLALIPIFLVWLYLTWIIVLLSVEISYVHHHYNALILHRAFTRLTSRNRLHLAVRMLVYIGATFDRGRKPPEIEDLVNRFIVPHELIEDLVELMCSSGLLLPVEITGEKTGYAPGRSLSAMTMRQAVDVIYREEGAILNGAKNDASDQVVEQILARGEQAAGTVFDEQTLLEVVKQIQAADQTKA